MQGTTQANDHGAARRVAEATDAALDAFWRTIAERYPEAKSGDIGFAATAQLETVARRAVGEWTSANVPTRYVIAAVYEIAAADAEAAFDTFSVEHPGAAFVTGPMHPADTSERAEYDVTVSAAGRAELERVQS